ncbi:MAG: dimethyladenosine transferase [Actinomycetales bacterium]|nr:dimethyladenosine transferase [Actinomycetales bacterium]
MSEQSRPAKGQVTVQRLIPAPAEAIFDILANPERHTEIDGSGTIRQARSSRGERRLKLGYSFGMDMSWGVSYATRNVVTEFEENRRIAWRTLAPSPLDKLFTGRTWRYELEPHENGTIVRETWDTTTEALPGRLFIGRLADLTRRNMTRTLERIEEVVTAQE